MDVDGDRRRVELPKKLKAWWFTDEDGKIYLNVKYGSKIIEFAKGKTAIEVGNLSDLLHTLEILKAAVKAGELDSQIAAVSGALRSGFLMSKHTSKK